MSGLSKKKLRPDEPDFGDEPLTADDSRLREAHAWYANKYNPKDMQDWLVDYLTDDGRAEDAEIVLTIKAGNITPTVYSNARLLFRGIALPTQTLEFFNSRLAKLLEDNANNPRKGGSTNRLSPAENLKERIRDTIAVIEDEVDKAYSDINHSFSLVEFFKKHQIKSVYAKAVYDYYLPKLAELIELANGDEQLIEGYKHFDEDRLAAYEDFLTALLTDAEIWMGANPTIRVRKKRKTDPAKQVSKVSYLAKFPELGLTSINPVKIIGANVVWVYNTKYRVLNYYVAADQSGLAIKGTTIRGFDPTNSIGKKIRKPETFLKSIMEGGKVSARKDFEAVKATKQLARGRLNEESIILRVST